MNEEILEQVRKDNVKFILLQFTDLHGMIKSVTIPVEKLAESFEKGTWFDGSSIEGFTRICESDMYLKPDPATYAVIPWESYNTARFICDVYDAEGNPFEGDPRQILRRTLKEAEEMGYTFKVGPELEFFLFKEGEDTSPASHDVAGYFDYSPRDQAADVRKELMLSLEQLGLEMELSHHEVAPGQHEIDFKYGEALRQADRCITFRQAVKSIANKYGLLATFMPKPVFGENGSGMHVHQSFFDINTGQNAFYDTENDYKLSSIARHFIGGQLAHIKALCAITSPTVNSYKRLTPGYEAPVYICWARRNRSALIRIPRYSPGREQSTRAELRCPDPSCNPYLAFAAMLKAGLDGIRNQTEPPAPVEEDVYQFGEDTLQKKGIGTLPSSLGEALQYLKDDTVMRDALGEHTFPIYLHAKKKEWDEYRIQVTPWELTKYLKTT